MHLRLMNRRIRLLTLRNIFKTAFNKEQLTNEIITITMNGLLPIQNKQEGFDHHLARLEKLVNRMEQS